MTSLEPLLLNDLGTIYKSWLDAPLGCLVSFGGCIAIGAGIDWPQTSEPRIAVIAGSSATVLMVIVEPEFLMCFDHSNTSHMELGTVTVAMGPAIDISGTHALGVADLAPAVEDGKFVAGDVLVHLASNDLWSPVNHPTYGRRGLKLRGKNVWQVEDMPIEGLNRIGRLVIVPKKSAVT
jgi:hypothetical protein